MPLISYKESHFISGIMTLHFRPRSAVICSKSLLCSIEEFRILVLIIATTELSLGQTQLGL